MDENCLNKALIKYMSVCGLWPDCSYSVFKVMSWILTTIFVQFLQYRFIIQHVQLENIPQFFDGLSITLAYATAFLGYIILLWNHRDFLNILMALSNDWKEAYSEKWELDLMTNTANKCYRYSKMIFTVHIVGSIFYALDIIINIFANIGSDTYRELVVLMDIPISYESSLVYYFVIAGQIVHQFYIDFGTTSLNGLIINLVMHLGTQLDIICELLNKISTLKDEGLVSDTLSRVIKKHQTTIKTSKIIDKLFCYVLLFRFLCYLFMICFDAFVIVLSLHNKEGFAAIAKFIALWVVMGGESFLWCFLGEHLKNKGDKVADAVYNVPWYNLKPAESRTLILLILRSYKRITISIGKFTDLSFATFMAIMKTSFSYLSVLNAMY